MLLAPKVMSSIRDFFSMGYSIFRTRVGIEPERLEEDFVLSGWLRLDWKLLVATDSVVGGFRRLTWET